MFLQIQEDEYTKTSIKIHIKITINEIVFEVLLTLYRIVEY